MVGDLRGQQNNVLYQIIEIRIDFRIGDVGQPNILVLLFLGTLFYLIQISQSFVLMAFVAYETQGLAGHFRTLINQLLSWFYFLVSNDRFISYSQCCNWCQILKLLLNFGCLFTFCYLDGANSMKTDLHICNLWTGQFVSYKSVI